MKYRLINEEDRKLIDFSLKADEYHKTTDSDFFYKPGTFSTLFSDDSGVPTIIARGSKALRLDIIFCDNNDHKRNAKVILQGFKELVNKAKEMGFNEIVACTNSPALKEFVKRLLKFEEVNVNGETELRRFL